MVILVSVWSLFFPVIKSSMPRKCLSQCHRGGGAAAVSVVCLSGWLQTIRKKTKKVLPLLSEFRFVFISPYEWQSPRQCTPIQCAKTGNDCAPVRVHKRIERPVLFFGTHCGYIIDASGICYKTGRGSLLI